VVPVEHAMALPLKGRDRLRGAVIVGRVGSGSPFVAADLEMAETFAQQAALALELSRARAAQQRLVVLEDRDRIGRDLHDHVIQRLFGASLTGQSLAEKSAETATKQGLVRLVADLTDTIRRIRSTIFALEDRVATASLRRTALMVVEQLTPVLGYAPELRMTGPLDTIASPGMDADVEAVLRELLTNVARHADATAVQVGLDASNVGLQLTVTDNGSGIGDHPRRSGLSNLRRRAERRDGDLEMIDQPEGGLQVRWAVPLTA
jgi:signal transduction histidine kinase